LVVMAVILTYVLIEGTFNRETWGHLGAFSDSIEKIARVDVWREL
jgi:hypothetical protein